MTDAESSTAVDPAACPHFAEFNPGLPEVAADPHEFLAKSRREVPVFFMPDYGLWAVTRYDDVREVLRDTETFSSAKMIRVPDVPAEYKDRLEHFPMKFAQPAGMDPPEHTPIRKLAQRSGFTQSAARARAEDIRAIADNLIDEFIGDGRVDLVPAYSELVPMFTAAVMLGVEPEDVELLRQWNRDSVDLMLEPLPPERLLEVSERMLAFDVYMRELIEQRRETPTDDVLSLLVHARGEDGDSTLTEAELLGLATVILTGGTDTTGGLIGRMFHLLLTHPEQWEEVKADPAGLADAVVEESLRLQGTVQGNVRSTTRDTEINGVKIPKDALVWIHLGSADRDESVFSHPDEFDIHRSKAEYGKHLALGRGTHFCLGAAFARLESKIALEAIAERIPEIRLADRDAPVEVYPSLFVAGILHLEAEW